MSNPEKELKSITDVIEDLIDQAVKLADKHNLAFSVLEQTYVGNNGTRLTVEDYWDGTVYEELSEDDPRYHEDEFSAHYAGWQNSSTFC